MTKDTVDGWKRMSFKGNKVWVQTDGNDNLAIEKNKVLMKYNLKQDYEYKVNPDNLKPVSEAVPSKTKKKQDKKPSSAVPTKKPSPEEQPKPDDTKITGDECITIYTDGASSGNPGPSGIGVLFIFQDKQREISRFIGQGTNNIAELTAIKVALEEVKRPDLPVRLHTDSNYALGLLTKGWKAKANQELITDIKKEMSRFRDLTFIKVKGHAGIRENEIADHLATSAIKKGLA